MLSGASLSNDFLASSIAMSLEVFRNWNLVLDFRLAHSDADGPACW